MSKVIEVWFDFNSPLSYLGIRNLEKAISFSKIKDVSILYRTLQIDPDFDSLAPEDLLNFDNYLNEQQHLLQLPKMKEIVKKSGVCFEFSKVIPTNTLSAHRLLQLEKKVNPDGDLESVAVLFNAYWTKGIDIGDENKILELARTVDIDPSLVTSMFQNDQMLSEIFTDERQAITLGVDAVPFFRFPNGNTVQGLLTIEQAQEILEQL